jgi:RimJ/RimL family protein N-acetyltransferase
MILREERMRVEPVTLEGSFVRLVPLSLADHPRLCAVGLEPALWESTTIRVGTDAEMLDYVRAAVAQREAGTGLPFAIVLRAADAVVGTTRFHSISPEHRRVEVGFTWVGLPWQRTAVNNKYLLLRHAFDRWHCARVEFKADAGNERSHSALLRIGATREGVLRQYMLFRHRGPRDVAVYSVIASEWPAVKQRLERRLYATPPHSGHLPGVARGS